jgi:hypothetical protein
MHHTSPSPLRGEGWGEGSILRRVHKETPVPRDELRVVGAHSVRDRRAMSVPLRRLVAHRVRRYKGGAETL